MTHVHTIPVPGTMTVEEAWQEILIMGAITHAGEPREWANIECDGECGQ